MAGMDMGGENKEMGRMMQEFERRMSAMESRLDEVSEAKERLERQVAAQTEELRVQRAAIARTQRAVRNMGQQAVDDSATEPALKQPE
jgi:septal ring factor EnvC (AmiA/AmiB activator)